MRPVAHDFSIDFFGKHMLTKSYSKVQTQRTHRRISWDLGTRSEYCLAGDYGFAEDKGDWWMTEESYVDTRVREFADYIQCDPELAQELYL